MTSAAATAVARIAAAATFLIPLRCLGSSELFERRNCLLVLGRIKDVYPQLTRHCKVLVEKIESLKSQPGLKSLADSCITLLSQRKSNAELDKEVMSLFQP